MPIQWAAATDRGKRSKNKYIRINKYRKLGVLLFLSSSKSDIIKGAGKAIITNFVFPKTWYGKIRQPIMQNIELELIASRRIL